MEHRPLYGQRQPRSKATPINLGEMRRQLRLGQTSGVVYALGRLQQPYGDEVLCLIEELVDVLCQDHFPPGEKLFFFAPAYQSICDAEEQWLRTEVYRLTMIAIDQQKSLELLPSLPLQSPHLGFRFEMTARQLMSHHYIDEDLLRLIGQRQVDYKQGRQRLLSRLGLVISHREASLRDEFIAFLQCLALAGPPPQTVECWDLSTHLVCPPSRTALCGRRLIGPQRPINHVPSCGRCRAHRAQDGGGQTVSLALALDDILDRNDQLIGAVAERQLLDDPHLSLADLCAYYRQLKWKELEAAATAVILRQGQSWSERIGAGARPPCADRLRILYDAARAGTDSSAIADLLRA